MRKGLPFLIFLLLIAPGVKAVELGRGLVDITPPEEEIYTVLEDPHTGELLANGQILPNGWVIAYVKTPPGPEQIRMLTNRSGAWKKLPGSAIIHGGEIPDIPVLCSPTLNSITGAAYWHSIHFIGENDPKVFISSLRKIVGMGRSQAVGELVLPDQSPTLKGLFVNQQTGEEFVVRLPGHESQSPGIYLIGDWRPTLDLTRTFKMVFEQTGDHFPIGPLEAVSSYFVFRQAELRDEKLVVKALARYNRQTEGLETLVMQGQVLGSRVVEKLLGFKANEAGETAVLFSSATRIGLAVFSTDGQSSLILEEETNFPPIGTVYSFVGQEVLLATNRESLDLDTLLLVDTDQMSVKELILPGDTLGGEKFGLGFLGGQTQEGYILQLNNASGDFWKLVKGQPARIPRPPVLTPEQVVNAANFLFGPVAPGEITSLFAPDLANSSSSAESVPLPVALGGLQITANGIVCPLYYAGPNQANFQIPFEVQGDSFGS